MMFHTVAAIATVFIFSCSVNAETKGRNTLRITGGYCLKPINNGDSCHGISTRNKTSDILYERLGRTKSDLELRGYKRVNVQTLCTNGNFNGFPWVQIGEKPYSHAVLTDKQGTVAGLQFLIPHSEVDFNISPNYRYDLQPAIRNVTIEDVVYFTVIVYYMDPTKICSEGRNASQLARDGTVTQLYIQNGKPGNFMKLAMSQSDTVLLKEWAYNNCYRWMGWHRFYRQVTWQYDNCETFQPFFLLYDNKGILNGYGIVFPGRASSPSIERPALDAITYIAGTKNNTATVPECLADTWRRIGLSSMHVYFTEAPWEFDCPVLESSHVHNYGGLSIDQWHKFDHKLTMGGVIDGVSTTIKDAIGGLFSVVDHFLWGKPNNQN